jgi:hypothetical protein
LDVEGSPPFTITIADIAASAQMLYGTEHQAGIKDFLPMNFLRILNKGGTTLRIYLNDNTNGEIILPDTIYTHGGEVWNFMLSNLSTTTTATGSLIYCTVQHKPVGAR